MNVPFQTKSQVHNWSLLTNTDKSPNSQQSRIRTHPRSEGVGGGGDGGGASQRSNDGDCATE